ncbi:hypothetical protein IC229_14685 [Spirosoma sp. BT702]|uniref:Uncharacterized protein n=1 Tax=Spirosoma profusum TaxID=2771354 RepID=A0A927AU12_9BACT|nr:hypothetical protein [Spirosoma profusum]MBD2701892.1 hypothetical protein [Spirosoma profusum]
MTQPNEQLPTEEPLITTENAEDGGTAPDSETQSSAASEAGGRTDEEGSRAPNDPAEGA